MSYPDKAAFLDELGKLTASHVFSEGGLDKTAYGLEDAKRVLRAFRSRIIRVPTREAHYPGPWGSAPSRIEAGAFAYPSMGKILLPKGGTPALLTDWARAHKPEVQRLNAIVDRYERRPGASTAFGVPSGGPGLNRHNLVMRQKDELADLEYAREHMLLNAKMLKSRPPHIQQMDASIVVGHEGDELRGRADPMFDRMFGHRNAEVILREHNRVATMPKEYAVVRKDMQNIRLEGGEADLLNKATGGRITYGEGPRMSRHARKRVAELIEREMASG